ncbi:MAG: hypothetical protein KDD67_14940 [Ignavibacteriae bacterium]|nr:hypothetical protein [Ignavibacteriota bacterium]MCB9217607.1 hypothetical protein [Ignavibacteria bacterium]
MRFLGALVLIFFAAGTASLMAQRISITPTEIYPGENVLTINAPGGIRSVRVVLSPRIESMAEVRKTGIIGGCPDSRDIEMRVDFATTITPLLGLVYIERCNGVVDSLPLPTLRSWNLDEVPFPDAEVGEEVCRPFQVTLSGGISGLEGSGFVVTGGDDLYLDSVSIPEPQARLRYSLPPPLTIKAGSVYRYNVCFKAEKPGIYKFPVITWIRREQPAGGYTNYPVADTGIIRVLPKRSNVSLSEIPLDTMSRDNPTPVTDPTIFRSVAVPNAVIPPKGKFFVGSYDLLGLTAGYSVADELLIFAGGAVPTPDDWAGVNGDMFGAWSVGAKLGTQLFGLLNIAVGYHYGQSILDKEFTTDELDSRITVSVPYGAISFGTDDRRVSVTAGYAFKRHSTWITTDPVLLPFRDDYRKDAAFGALGGDYRFAKHWKVATEFAMMQTVDVAPIIFTARYFTNTFAIDFGAAYAGLTLNNAEAPPFPVLPMLSAIFVF